MPFFLRHKKETIKQIHKLEIVNRLLTLKCIASEQSFTGEPLWDSLLCSSQVPREERQRVGEMILFTSFQSRSRGKFDRKILVYITLLYILTPSYANIGFIRDDALCHYSALAALTAVSIVNDRRTKYAIEIFHSWSTLKILPEC